MKELEETWSGVGKCVNYTCEYIAGDFVVTPEYPSCAELPKDCPAERIVEKDCCKICLEPPQSQGMFFFLILESSFNDKKNCFSCMWTGSDETIRHDRLN